MPPNLQATNPEISGHQSSYLTLYLWWNFVFLCFGGKKDYLLSHIWNIEIRHVVLSITSYSECPCYLSKSICTNPKCSCHLSERLCKCSESPCHLSKSHCKCSRWLCILSKWLCKCSKRMCNLSEWHCKCPESDCEWSNSNI